MKLAFAAGALALASLGTQAWAAGVVVVPPSPITYTVSQSVGGATVTGTVTTDGSLGPLTTVSPFLDWNLTLSDGSFSASLNSGNSFIFNVGQAFEWTATASDLTFNHGVGDFFAFYALDTNSAWCLEGPNSGCFGAPSASVVGLDLLNSQSFSVDQGPSTVFAAAAASTVPEPGVLVLLGIACLAALGSSRRKA